MARILTPTNLFERGSGGMIEKKNLEDVFKTVGLPPYTYVKPSYYGDVRADIVQPGKQLLIEGPSGIGKTCVVYKVFEDLKWVDGSQYKYITCRESTAATAVNEFIASAVEHKSTSWPLLVVDDFHLLDTDLRAQIGARLKQMSDLAFSLAQPPKICLIGIPATGISLLQDSYDLGPRLGSYRLTKATDTEIRRLVEEGENALNVIFEDDSILLSEIDGNFWLGQYMCNKICSGKEVFETCDDTKILSFDLLTIRKRLMTELFPRFITPAVTFSKGKKWRPGGNKPYLEVLLSVCKIPDSVITFDRVLNSVPDRRKPGIKAIRPRISEVIYDPAKGIDLRKQIVFNSDCFSIEDPLFRYFLTYMESAELFRNLGIGANSLEEGRAYPYDIGFSFAGETRQIVEVINDNFKDEDVITFYDFDQQAFLLAQDLESTLGKIYAESCRFYLTFLDKYYKDKVWTRFEQEIMTKPGRSNHIIPVILDDEGMVGNVGIKSTLGRIDLRDIWKQVQIEKSINKDALNTIRNRCIVPILEKIDHPDI
jgi:hypothetical protein